MSRIAKKLIKIPSGVELKLDKGLITARGPKGSLSKNFPGFLDVEINDASVKVFPRVDPKSKEEKSMWGLSRAVLANMLKGVSEGFQKTLEFSGVGFRAQVKGDQLELNLGFTNPVNIKAPPDLSFKVEKNTIVVSGIDKELVGRVAASIRAARPPEPYKASGIKYKDEIIKKKAGKKAVAAGT